MSDALTRANNFFELNMLIRSIDGRTGVQFIQEFRNINGNRITRCVGFDLNPT